jgi:hypothetical protein
MSLGSSGILIEHRDIRRNVMLFHVILEQAEDGWIVAECPAASLKE